MTSAGEWDWLDVLRTPNADVPRFNEVLDRFELRVPTRLDALADQWLDPARGLRCVLLVAHAGDGKTEFLRLLMRRAKERGVALRSFDHEGTQPGWADGGAWLLNDPSQLPTGRVREFLGAAFAPASTHGARFVAGINRGLLRAIVRREDPGGTAPAGWSEARGWLRRALDFEEGAHAPDEFGRLAVPLDRRVLVPGPSHGDASCAGEVARRVLAKVHAKLADAAWDANVWAGRVARALSLVEASGHHVTFREVLALAAGVGLALRDEPASKEPRSALAALFMAADSTSARVPSLAPLVTVLRRLDPAKVPQPDADIAERAGDERDARVRREALEALAGAPGGVAPALGIPYETAGMFLGVCRRVAQGAGPTDAPAEKRAVETVFRGLARVAWGREGRHADTDLDVLPLTSPVHPGATAGGARVLRAALSIDRARFVAEGRACGDHVERGLTLPSLVIERESREGPEPRLRLDLELFDMLARVGRDRHADVALLGPRAAQVAAWFDALVAAWDDAIASPSRAGVVTFQTFLVQGGVERPVALRPAGLGADAKLDDATLAGGEVLDVLGRVVKACVVTPSACASALLRWAGFAPLAAEPKVPVRQLEREATGAVGPARVGRQSNLRAPAFPWSSHTLALALDAKGAVDSKSAGWRELGCELGAACAHALGLDDGLADGWRGALRAAWAADERAFDAHPSARLAHQWLGVGVEGLQLERVAGRSPPGVSDVRRGVVADLLAAGRAPPFSRPLRWWLLGTWASWWLLLEGLRAAHERGGELPLLLPWVSEPRGAAEYVAVRDAWFLRKDREDELKPVRMLAQGSGWLTPSSAITRFDLLLDGPLVDVLRLVARRVHREGEGRPDKRTLIRLQQALLDAGLYAQPPGVNVHRRVPPKTLAFESPDSMAFDEALRATLQRLGMLDAASDGATLFNAPWGEEV